MTNKCSCTGRLGSSHRLWQETTHQRPESNKKAGTEQHHETGCHHRGDGEIVDRRCAKHERCERRNSERSMRIKLVTETIEMKLNDCKYTDGNRDGDQCKQ